MNTDKERKYSYAHSSVELVLFKSYVVTFNRVYRKNNEQIKLSYNYNANKNDYVFDNIHVNMAWKQWRNPLWPRDVKWKMVNKLLSRVKVKTHDLQI